jgi:hypothetical protein
MAALVGQPATRLSRRFLELINTTAIGGSSVLQELSDLASECISGTSDAQDTVAFALSETFKEHAEDRYERAVTTGDNYQLIASGEECLTEAVKFIENGGAASDAVRIAATLARLTPDRLRPKA